ncbi:MAG: hypothetical protein ACXQTD_09620 [Candidatus Syntropharchaeia archaeon]
MNTRTKEQREITAIVLDQTEKALLIQPEGSEEPVWVGKSIIDDGVVPAWAMRQKGIPSAVRIMTEAEAEGGEEKEGEKTRPDLHGLESEMECLRVIYEVSDVMRICIREANEIVKDEIKIDGLTPGQRAQLVEAIGVTLFIQTRREV